MPDTVVPSVAERRVLSQLCDWAVTLAEIEGAPQFTAAVMAGDTEVCRARNDVARTHDPSRHAEIAAIAEAGRSLGRRDLAGHTLISSCQPCEMCLAAMRWAGIDRLIFAATQDNLGPGFFQFGALSIADLQRASGGAFAYAGGVDEARVLHIYQPRGSGRPA